MYDKSFFREVTDEMLNKEFHKLDVGDFVFVDSRWDPGTISKVYKKTNSGRIRIEINKTLQFDSYGRAMGNHGHFPLYISELTDSKLNGLHKELRRKRLDKLIKDTFTDSNYKKMEVSTINKIIDFLFEIEFELESRID